VWAALGLYPVVPGRDVLAVNGPLFPRVDVRLPHGRLTVIGRGAGPHRPYVHGLRLDGRAWRRTWIPFRRLASGRHVLRFRMGARPGSWGRR
jgi:putative alpha-1,2-mannosidase